MQLYKFRTEIDTWRFNDSKKTVNLLSQTWNPAPIRRKKWEQSISDQEISISLSMDVEPSLNFVARNPSHPVWVDVYDGSLLTIILSGKIISAKHDMKRGMVEFRVMIFSQFMDSAVPRKTYSPSCSHALFDNACGVDENETLNTPSVGQGTFKLSLLKTDPLLVISSSGLEFTHPLIADYAAVSFDYFNLGSVRNGAEELFIISHVGDTVITLTPFIRETNVTYDILAGCDKFTSTCVAKFFPPGDPNVDGNVNNFGGYPKMPRKNPVTDGY